MTTTANNYKNLSQSLIKESAKELKEFKIGLKSAEDLNLWFYNNLLTATTAKAGYFKSDKEKKEYLLKRYEAKQEKKLTAKLKQLETVFNADKDIADIKISVEWKKSAMWGANPTAEAEFIGKNFYEFKKSGSISGCGYDKESTAIAEALNQCNALLNKMYAIKEANPKKTNNELFGYGSGHGLMPYFEGGVGISCYYRIFEKIGLKLERVAGGKTFDIYRVSKP